jgi:toxin CptA
MHTAPSVNYPVARSSRAAMLLAAVSFAGLAGLCLWIRQPVPLGWRHLVAGSGWLAATAWAVVAWHRTPAGVLAWNGSDWNWKAAGNPDAVPGELALATDLGWAVLTRWTPVAGRDAWFWIERGSAPAHWDALRRAVYSRARKHAPQGA